MSRYSRIWAEIWDEPWSDDARTVAFYLLTCRHRTTEGIYRLPPAYAAEDLRWPVERFHEGLAELLREGFAEYDETARVVLIVKALKRQKLENPNQVKAAVAQVAALPETPLTSRLLTLADRYCQRFAEGLRERFPEGFAEPPTPTPAPTQAPATNDVAADGDDRATDVESVWEAYDETRRKVLGERRSARLTSDRRGFIARRLKTWPVEDLADAARGWQHFPHNRGENDRGTPYCDVELVLKDAAHIERFRDAERNPASRPRLRSLPGGITQDWKRLGVEDGAA